ncbi:MAG: DUF86 domain-containing protein [Anaerolineales bacterium]|nr:DUF86 domain-containing protein [Anaerolineales bacterium]
MKRDYLVYVEDMAEAMDKAELLLEGILYEQFEADFRINFAVVRALEIIGEAAKRLPPSFRDQYPAIPWKKMAGMRDRIIHGYDNVNLQIVWDTVKQEIPAIKPLLQQILDQT